MKASKRCATIVYVEPFDTYTGKIAVLDQDAVDTDRIIPARFLSRVSRSGYGELLFKDVRGPGFPLDQPEAHGASILLTGSNFGCGSSREHAVWAIQQAGFRAVIARRTPEAEGFSDIFRQNAANCGLLLIELDEPQWRALAGRGTGAEVSIDLPNQKIDDIGFDIDQATKKALMEGLDLIGTTLIHADAITEFEKTSGPFVPPQA